MRTIQYARARVATVRKKAATTTTTYKTVYSQMRNMNMKQNGFTNPNEKKKGYICVFIPGMTFGSMYRCVR